MKQHHPTPVAGRGQNLTIGSREDATKTCEENNQ